MTHVKDLLSSSKTTWNVDLICNLFSPEIAKAIVSTLINPLDPFRSDTPLWLPSRDGSFTSKSCYSLLRSSTTQTPSNDPETTMLLRRFLKGNDIIPHIKDFAWQSLFNALPTNARRSATIPAIDPICALCKEHAETIDHLLFSCTLTHQVWTFTSCPPIHDSLTFRDNLLLWFKCEEATSARAIAICWCLWKARCEFIFASNPIDISAIIRRAEEYIVVPHPPSPDASMPSGLNHTQESSWKAHPSAYITINVDGASRQPQSYWGLIGRTLEGKVSFVSTGKVEQSSTILVEAHGIPEALKLASTCKDFSTHVFSDAQVLINCILTPNISPPWQVHHIVHECIWILCQNPLMSISYTRRSLNVAAHSLAAATASFELYGHWLPQELPNVLISAICITPSGVCLD